MSSPNHFFIHHRNGHFAKVFNASNPTFYLHAGGSHFGYTNRRVPEGGAWGFRARYFPVRTLLPNQQVYILSRSIGPLLQFSFIFWQAFVSTSIVMEKICINTMSMFVLIIFPLQRGHSKYRWRSNCFKPDLSRLIDGLVMMMQILKHLLVGWQAAPSVKSSTIRAEGFASRRVSKCGIQCYRACRFVVRHYWIKTGWRQFSPIPK